MWLFLLYFHSYYTNMFGLPSDSACNVCGATAAIAAEWKVSDEKKQEGKNAHYQIKSFNLCSSDVNGSWFCVGQHQLLFISFFNSLCIFYFIHFFSPSQIPSSSGNLWTSFQSNSYSSGLAQDLGRSRDV